MFLCHISLILPFTVDTCVFFQDYSAGQLEHWREPVVELLEGSQLMKQHNNLAHKKLTPYKCEICSYSTAYSSHLKRHVDAVHHKKLKLKTYKCEQCGYSTVYPSNLKRHDDLVHKRLKPLKCNLCDYSTAISSHLKMHVEAVHENFKPHKCIMCAYTGSQLSDLKRHVGRVHKEQTS